MVATLTHFIYGALGWKTLNFDISIWMALLLSQLPDLDFIIGIFTKDFRLHRRYFHNVFVFALMVFAAGYFVGFLAALFFIGLHILLDLIDSEGVPLFYPFTKKNYLIYEVGHERKLPEKIFWDATWWFVIVAVITCLLLVLLP